MIMQKIPDQILSLICLEVVSFTDCNDVFPDDLQPRVRFFIKAVGRASGTCTSWCFWRNGGESGDGLEFSSDPGDEPVEPLREYPECLWCDLLET